MAYLDSTDLGLISAIEDRIFLDYVRIIEQYTDRFASYGCNIIIRKIWRYDIGKPEDGIIFYERPPLKPGYSFGISFDVVDENGVVIESDDHDMYMSMGWGILRYGNDQRRRRKQILVGYDEAELNEDDVREELEDFLGNMEFCGRHRLK